jgi:hypothetical protein
MERVPCANQDSCRWAVLEQGCHEDKHHLFWPRQDYKTPTEKRFRELDENKVIICRNFHDEEHALFPPPDKPDLEIMRMAIAEQRNRRLGAAQNGD